MSATGGGAIWSVPSPPVPRDLEVAYQEYLTYVNEVNHGEFENAADLVLHNSKLAEEGSKQRPVAVAIQRCRRGGKTFMLHAVGALLQGRARLQEHSSQVLLISLNGISPFDPSTEDAYQAIMARLAWELSGREAGTFRRFKQLYTSDFGAADAWLTDKENHVMLLIDELNAIPPEASRYGDMSSLLAEFVQQKGSGLLYSTHQRSTANLLRRRLPGTETSLGLSKNPHKWAQIPRIQTVKCLQGLSKDASEQPSFWSAVLRGRIPALVVQEEEIPNYAEDAIGSLSSPEGVGMSIEQERQLCLAAVITGNIDQLPNRRNLFRAYSYMSERFVTNPNGQAWEFHPVDPRKTIKDGQCFAWPPFLIAQHQVLGKNYRRLRAPLEDPEIDEPKAFEALAQLAILVRLLAKQKHELVPFHSSIMDAISTCNAQDATEMFHVAQTATTLEDILGEVKARFKRSPHVVQVVAAPIYASFPTYDFFLLHREGERNWKTVVGYQCKQGTENPSEEAWKDVPVSVWIEGKCRMYRVQEDGQRVSKKLHRGWTLLSESHQANLLGVSIAEALPQAEASSQEERQCCRAEQAWDQSHLDSQGYQNKPKRQRLEFDRR